MFSWPPVFVGVMTYSQYAYAEAFKNEKQLAWITAHQHMYDYFGGVARVLVSDNCTTAVIHSHASMLMNSGISIKQISQRLGHKDIKITLETYAHLYKEKEKELVDSLEKIGQKMAL